MEQNTLSQQSSQPSETQPKNGARRYVRPAASIIETGDGFVLQVEMPGVKRAGLEVTFENGELTLVGHRTGAGQNAAPEALYRESRQADFRRVFEVDSTIDAARIFDKIFVMTNGGGPGTATETLTMSIYKTAFIQFDFGYAAALSFLFQLVLLVLGTVYVRRVLAEA